MLLCQSKMAVSTLVGFCWQISRCCITICAIPPVAATIDATVVDVAQPFTLLYHVDLLLKSSNEDKMCFS